jgi:hypothetical protein
MTQGPETAMPDILIEPKDCTLVLVDRKRGCEAHQIVCAKTCERR